MRTIIDILQKGNLELFHSTMIAWLLNPTSIEHDLGRILLDGIAAKLDTKGFPRFKQVLDSTEAVSVRTEVARFGSRYDIEIRCGNSLIVLENKTKSCGEELQLEDYNRKNPDAILVALGLCKESFSHGVEQKYPLITYGDVLQILRNVTIPNNDWGVLIKHYIRFLERTISILELTAQYYEGGDLSKYDEIVGLISNFDDWTENDNRFLNLFLLEKLRRRLLDRSSKFKGFKWASNKNERSGVWLASGADYQPENYKFTDAIEILLRKYSARLWFHIELATKGILAKELTDVVGTFQLKGSVDPNEDNRKFADEFMQKRALRSDEDKAKNISSSSGSFFVVKKLILKQDLFLDKLEKNFTEFFERFGVFRS